MQAVDGPYLKISGTASSAALGYDGKWMLHPSQIEPVNLAFAPSEADYSRAAR